MNANQNGVVRLVLAPVTNEDDRHTGGWAFPITALRLAIRSSPSDVIIGSAYT